jgi:cytochrome c5
MKFKTLIFCFAMLIFPVASVSASDDIGQSVYANSCAACHASGVMGAGRQHETNRRRGESCGNIHDGDE